MLPVSCLSKWLPHARIPSRTQLRFLEGNDSSQMWSMKWSLRVFVYIQPPSCLMTQNPNKLATSSNKLTSLCTLHWCEEFDVRSRLRRHPREQEVASGQYAPKNVTHRVNHRVVCPDPPPHWCNQHHTVNTAASWVTPETQREIFLLRRLQSSHQ